MPTTPSAEPFWPGPEGDTLEGLQRAQLRLGVQVSLGHRQWEERCEDPEDWEYFDCPRECR